MRRRGLDTNVLIYAHFPALAEHQTVRSFLIEQLEDAESVLVLAPTVLLELVHTVTDQRRFQPALKMADAIDLAQSYIGRPNLEILPIDDLGLMKALDLLAKHRLGRKRLSDTLFASLLLDHGVRELITCNPKDFRIFRELQLIDPKAARAPRPTVVARLPE